MPCFKGCCDYLRSPFRSSTVERIAAPPPLPTNVELTGTAKKTQEAAKVLYAFYYTNISYQIKPEFRRLHPDTIESHEVYVPYNSEILKLIQLSRNALDFYSISGLNTKIFTPEGIYKENTTSIQQIFEDMLNPEFAWHKGITEIRKDLNAYQMRKDADDLKSKEHKDFLEFVDNTLTPIVHEALGISKKASEEKSFEPFDSNSQSINLALEYQSS